MSFLNIKSLERIEKMTLSEYFYLMEARKYDQLEEVRRTYELAFAIRDVQATENVGTEKAPKEQYIFKSVSDVIDYEENYKRLKNGETIVFKGDKNVTPSRNKDLKAMLQKLAENNG